MCGCCRWGDRAGDNTEDLGDKAKGAARDTERKADKWADKAGNKAEELGDKAKGAARDTERDADRMSNRAEGEAKDAGRDTKGLFGSVPICLCILTTHVFPH